MEAQSATATPVEKGNDEPRTFMGSLEYRRQQLQIELRLVSYTIRCEQKFQKEKAAAVAQLREQQ